MDKHYNYALIDGSDIKLFNNSTIEFRPTNCDALEDVDVDIDGLGILTIKAKRIEYDLYVTGGRVYECDWNRVPEKKLIKEGKMWFWSRKKTKYVFKLFKNKKSCLINKSYL